MLTCASCTFSWVGRGVIVVDLGNSLDNYGELVGMVIFCMCNNHT